MTLNTLRTGELTPFGIYQGNGQFSPNPYTPWTSKTGFDCAGLHSEGYEPVDMNCSDIIAPAPVASVIEPVQQQGQVKPSDWILLAVVAILAVLLLRK